MPEYQDFLTFFLSMLPGVFWIVYLRSLSGGRTSPWWHWVLALAGGWLSTLLTLYLSEVFSVEALQLVPYVGWFLFFVLGVGLVEEGCKAFFAALFLKLAGLGKHPLFTLQLSCGVALGFATTENLLYARSFGDHVLVGRFVFSTLAHLLFASVWGFALGERSGRTPWRSFVFLLMVSAFCHGLFDWFLITDRAVLAVLTLAVMWFGFREAALGAYLRQLYRRTPPFEMKKCAHCSVLTRGEGSYCSFCGEAL